MVENQDCVLCQPSAHLILWQDDFCRVVLLNDADNKTPHMHWHIIPRFETDKHFPNSHWGEATQTGKQPALSLAVLGQLKTKITAHITCALGE